MDNRKVMITIGVFLLLPGLLVAVVSFSMMFSGEDDTPSNGNQDPGEEETSDPESGCCMLTTCAPVFIVPAIILLFLGFKTSKEPKITSTPHNRSVADLLKAHDTMKLDDIARILRMDIDTARFEAARSISQGHVKGKIKNDVFYSDAYLRVSENNLRRREYLIDMADILKAYRRIEIGDFAGQIDMDEDSAERIILECLEDGLVKGYISRRSRVFFTMDYLDQLDDVQVGWDCPGCGANNHEVLLPGEIDRCPYCGTMSKARGTKVRFLAEELEDLEL